MSPSIMAALKATTAHLHARTEEQVAKLRPFSGLDAYRTYLTVMHALHAVHEPAIEAAPGVETIGLDLAARRKLPLLERDLSALGTAPSAFSRPDPIPLATAAEAIGALYVLEGSTLGGQILRRQLEGQLPEAVRLGATSYLTCYGPNTGVRWKEFREAAERCCTGAEQREAALEAAVRTFAAFEARFAAHAVHGK